jgi:hypothetical protein
MRVARPYPESEWPTFSRFGKRPPHDLMAFPLGRSQGPVPKTAHGFPGHGTQGDQEQRRGSARQPKRRSEWVPFRSGATGTSKAYGFRKRKALAGGLL